VAEAATSRAAVIDLRRPLDRSAIVTFCSQLREAREHAFRDAEAFDDIIHVVERLGSFLTGRIGDLGKYKEEIERIAIRSALAEAVSDQWRALHIPFTLLYRLVKNARNDALHQGAFARHLTGHAIELSLLLEDAMRQSLDSAVAGDYMVRNPVCAELWQPISFIRQQMLANSFSFLPVKGSDDIWCLVSDLQIARHLGSDPEGRKPRLARSLKDAGLQLQPAEHCQVSDSLEDTLLKLDRGPVLVFEHDERTPVGILTAFDVL
jgi:CBS domain-containing protein